MRHAQDAGFFAAPESPLLRTIQVEADNEESARELAAERLGVFPEFVRLIGKPDKSNRCFSAEFGYDAEQMATDGALICEALLDRMGIRGRIRILRRRRIPFLDISAGRDSQLVIGRNGQNIDAIQTIVDRMLVRCRTEQILLTVDCEDYLERHRQRLAGLAAEAARKVLATGEPVHMAPMAPGDRKAIHNMFIGHPKLVTVSVGEDLDRHVVIQVRTAADA
jgi:predicted RNA-binding protein Jag